MSNGTTNADLDRYLASKGTGSDEEDLDSLLDDPDFDASYRESRTQQIYTEAAQARRQASDSSVRTLNSEDELFELTATTLASEGLADRTGQRYPIVVVHFFQPGFRTCQIMDSALEKIAQFHYNTTKVVRIEVKNAPFLTARLNVRVLPCVLVYVNGKETKRLVGLQELGNDPNKLEYSVLERVLYASGAVKRLTTDQATKSSREIMGFANKSSSIRGAQKPTSYDSDDDWD